MHRMQTTQIEVGGGGTVNLVVAYALILGQISQLPVAMRRFVATALAIKSCRVMPRR